MPGCKLAALATALCVIAAGAACTVETTVHEVAPVEVGVAAEGAKTRAKQQRQFLQTLHAHVYQAPLSPADAVALDELLRSVGDKQVGVELVVAKMVADPGARLPSDADLRADPEGVVGEVYRRFYVREATRAELSWWGNYVDTHPEVDVQQLVYAFVTAAEYRYY